MELAAASILMCNLYSIATNQAAIAALFRVMNRYVGSPPPMPGLIPDYPAPVVHNAGAEREIVMMRWSDVSLRARKIDVIVRMRRLEA
jgi:putative SOS response-associated peptidase YedK